MSGRLRECAWETLKAVYLGGTTEQACVEQLAAWSREHGIELDVEIRSGYAGSKPIAYNVVKFKPR
jgi:hypothetical protein